MLYELITKYHSLTTIDPHHRYKSWEHCYNFFKKHAYLLDDEEVFDRACLHLAFYLASWGMLRGGSFLLQKDYRIHNYFLRGVVQDSRFKGFLEMNSILEKENLYEINHLIDATIKAYTDNITIVNGQEKRLELSDTLISKILLGVYGNVPAYDRYFKQGLRIHGISQQLNRRSLLEIVDFYKCYRDDFDNCIQKFSKDGVDYTPMKLVDMYFWQIGYLLDTRDAKDKEIINIQEFASNYLSKKSNLNTHKEIHRGKKTVLNAGLTNSIREYIIEKLNTAKLAGSTSIDIKSGNIHKELELQNRMPAVCNAMVSLNAYRYQVIHDTPSGASSTKVVRYYMDL